MYLSDTTRAVGDLRARFGLSRAEALARLGLPAAGGGRGAEEAIALMGVAKEEAYHAVAALAVGLGVSGIRVAGVNDGWVWYDPFPGQEWELAAASFAGPLADGIDDPPKKVVARMSREDRAFVLQAIARDERDYARLFPNDPLSPKGLAAFDRGRRGVKENLTAARRLTGEAYFRRPDLLTGDEIRAIVGRVVEVA